MKKDINRLKENNIILILKLMENENQAVIDLDRFTYNSGGGGKLKSGTYALDFFKKNLSGLTQPPVPNAQKQKDLKDAQSRKINYLFEKNRTTAQNIYNTALAGSAYIFKSENFLANNQLALSYNPKSGMMTAYVSGLSLGKWYKTTFTAALNESYLGETSALAKAYFSSKYETLLLRKAISLHNLSKNISVKATRDTTAGIREHRLNSSLVAFGKKIAKAGGAAAYRSDMRLKAQQRLANRESQLYQRINYLTDKNPTSYWSLETLQSQIPIINPALSNTSTVETPVRSQTGSGF